jgi:hypothetical protein
MSISGMVNAVFKKASLFDSVIVQNSDLSHRKFFVR